MTVCAAAVYLEIGEPEKTGYGIFTVSDRMLTEAVSGRTSEPMMDKVFPLTQRSQLLSAGDILDDRPIWEAAMRAAKSGTALAGIVGAYQEEYTASRGRIAELLYLKPHGLTMSTWPERQQTMKTSLVLSIATKLEQTNLLDVDALICGFDVPDGKLPLPHLYRISDFGRVTAHDTEGIVAVGAGADVVFTEFQIAGYVRIWDRARTLRLLYSAKKKTEAIESVGTKTDLFEITPTDIYNRNDWLPRLDEICGRADKDMAAISGRADLETKAFLDEPE